ncbi:hypothetical protein Clim_0517 [Chlorobium limicola DSM 245]|uniref:Uncharacterized protein n=1 Tax=Chlorobium limicola (strain DSM 245 / NBRC 103803 / 6330) TaxID=290315 RepID=B3EGH2_CHLL2|nr:hypothetical protein Clim_0517 [Chlorobium limicola DSM 245]
MIASTMSGRRPDSRILVLLVCRRWSGGECLETVTLSDVTCMTTQTDMQSGFSGFFRKYTAPVYTPEPLQNFHNRIIQRTNNGSRRSVSTFTFLWPLHPLMTFYPFSLHSQNLTGSGSSPENHQECIIHRAPRKSYSAPGLLRCPDKSGSKSSSRKLSGLRALTTHFQDPP